MSFGFGVGVNNQINNRKGNREIAESSPEDKTVSMES